MDERTTPDSQNAAGEGYPPPEAPLEGGQPPAEASPQPTPPPPPAPEPAPQPQPQPAPAPQTAAPPPVVEAPRERDRGRRTLGIVLIALGAVFLVNQFIAWDIFWPVILIVIGLIVLFRR